MLSQYTVKINVNWILQTDSLIINTYLLINTTKIKDIEENCGIQNGMRIKKNVNDNKVEMYTYIIPIMYNIMILVQKHKQ